MVSKCIADVTESKSSRLTLPFRAFNQIQVRTYMYGLAKGNNVKVCDVFHSKVVGHQQTDPLSFAPLQFDQSQPNEGPTNKVQHACANHGARGRVVQKGIGELHAFLLTRASWAEPPGSVYCEWIWTFQIKAQTFTLHAPHYLSFTFLIGATLP